MTLQVFIVLGGIGYDENCFILRLFESRGLTSDVEKVNTEDTICPCNTRADGAVTRII